MDKSTKARTIIGIIVLIFANTAAGGAEWCSSALADIANVFPDVPYSIITLVNNIPNLCAVVFTIVAGVLVNRKITLRNMLLIGIGCHCIGGILPALFGDTSMAMMFLGRFAFGIGYGLMQGIGISMSLKLVEDSRFRSHAMGWAVAAQYAMNMVAQVVVGHLCAIKWNYSFFVYLWSAIPFLVVLFLCPKFELDKNDTSTTGGKLEAMAKSGSLGQAIKGLAADSMGLFCYSDRLYALLLPHVPRYLQDHRRARHRQFCHCRQCNGVLLGCNNSRRRCLWICREVS